MKKVIAAVDESLATGRVLATAGAVGRALRADVEAVHVRTDGAALAEAQCEHAGVPLRIVPGDTVTRLAEAAAEPGVVALVLGARGGMGRRRPLGTTALEVTTSVDAPVVVVPPEGGGTAEIARILVPLSSSLASARAPRRMIELASPAGVEIVVLHVHDVSSLPLFTDQPQHESTAWANEFLARYCPVDRTHTRLLVRVGLPEDEILGVADEVQADLIALGWGGTFDRGRAPIVRSLLEHARVPVALIPVTPANHSERRPAWTESRSSRT
jgi:nucleotide-binding universal stress UspA family protein